MVLIAGVAQQESAWQPDVMYGTRDSRMGAQGTMQIMPGTLGGIEKRMGETIDPYDPGQSLRAGANELRHLTNLFGNDLEMVLVGYNAGIGHASDYGTDIIEGNISWPETQEYLAKVPLHIFNLENPNRPQTHGYRIESPIEFPGEMPLKFENRNLHERQSDWLRSPAERDADVISYPPEYRGIGSQVTQPPVSQSKGRRKYGSVSKLFGKTMMDKRQKYV